MDIRSHRFLSFFTEEDQGTLSDLTEELSCSDGTLIFDEGDATDGLYLILQGNVALWKKGMNDSLRKIAIIESNEFFGELGVIDGGARSARAVAIGNVRLAKIPHEPLMEILRRSPGHSVLDMMCQIIERLRITNELYITEAVRKERMMMVGEMANTIIHDFKNPFAVIQLAVDFISRQHKEAETQQFCKMIEEQIDRVTEMTHDILDFSRTTTRLNRKATNLSEVIQQFVRLHLPYLKENNVSLEYLPIDVTLRIDADKIMRILQNVVANCVEAFRGQDKAHIKVVATLHEQQVVLAITDNGPGIPVDVQEHLFEPFITSGKDNGCGLGMAIARTFAEAHGGSLTFETAEGKGTTFYLTLPLPTTNELADMETVAGAAEPDLQQNAG